MSGAHASGSQAPTEQPMSRPEVLWIAPGSVSVDELEAVWAAKGDLRDLARIPGPWGAVLWCPGRRQHVVVVDPVGVQPLFWTRDDRGGIVVGSWLEAVVNSPGVSKAIDYEGVLMDSGRDFRGEATLQRTRFKAVRKIPMGRALWIDAACKTSISQYWDPERIALYPQDLSDHESAFRLRAAIEAAVRRLTPPSRGVAAHLSGGLDSSAVAALADDVLKESGFALQAAFSWSPDENQQPLLEHDERDLIRQITEPRGIPLYFAAAGERGDWFYRLDQDTYPQATHVWEKFILPVAQDLGVHTMLSGWGGDELSSSLGKRVPIFLMRSGRVAEALRETRDLQRLRPWAQNSALRRARSYLSLLIASYPSLSRQLRFSQISRNERYEDELNKIIGQHFPTAAAVREEYQRRLRDCKTQRERQLILLEGGQLQQRTAWWYQTGRLFGISYRYPLLDLPVVSVALGLPHTAYRHRGLSRVAFHLAASSWIPGTWPAARAKEENALNARDDGMRGAHIGLRRWATQRVDLEYENAMRLARLTHESPQL